MSHYVANQSTGYWTSARLKIDPIKFWVLLWTVCRCTLF